MFTAIRSVRIIQQPSLFSSTSSTLPNYLTVRPSSGIRFRQAAAGASHHHHHQDNNPEEMEQSQSQPKPAEDKRGDVMSHSFGEAYSTRSSDEGFGCIYGDKQSLPGGDEDLGVHVDNAPEYDKNQGSEVKEQEQGRHQTRTQLN